MSDRHPVDDQENEEIVPVVEEVAVVRKERQVTGRVRLTKEVHEVEQIIDEPLQTEEIEVERIPIDRWVDEAVPIRQEGDTTIIPVLKEVAVVVKRLKLVEEVRVTRRHVTVYSPESVTLRREEVVVEREDKDGD